MSLSARVSKLETTHQVKGRLIPLWCEDQDDLNRKVERMRAAGEMTDADTVIIVMWGIAEPERFRT